MRVQTEEWQRFIPGVRMHKGKKTLFYNGETLQDDVTGEFLVYTREEQRSWEVIFILPGVEVITGCTFSGLEKLEAVIMSDSIRRIEESAFLHCQRLTFVKLSRSLEFIGRFAFVYCSSLTSIYIPPSCREIGRNAFTSCKELIIFSVPRQTQLGENVIRNTALIRASTFEIDESGHYETSISANVNEWIKNINRNDDEYSLHRACSSFNPMTEIIYDIVKRQGLSSFKKKNEIDVTPMQYLALNPFAEAVDQSAIVKRYVVEMMGEAVIEPW